MINSKDEIDRRLIDMIRVQQASRQGIRLGFKGLNLKEHDKFRLKDSQTQKGEFFDVSFDDEDSINNENNKNEKKEEVKAQLKRLEIN